MEPIPPIISTDDSNARSKENSQVQSSDAIAALNLLRKEFKEDIDNVKKDYLNIFGIFVAFVTFLSIEIQILKSTDDKQMLIGLSLLTISGILLFVIMVTNVIKDQDKWTKKLASPLSIVSLLLLSISLFYLNQVKFNNKIAENNSKSEQIKKQVKSVFYS